MVERRGQVKEGVKKEEGVRKGEGGVQRERKRKGREEIETTGQLKKRERDGGDKGKGR